MLIPRNIRTEGFVLRFLLVAAPICESKNQHGTSSLGVMIGILSLLMVAIKMDLLDLHPERDQPLIIEVLSTYQIKHSFYDTTRTLSLECNADAISRIAISIVSLILVSSRSL
jgi:hypothetical protein